MFFKNKELIAENQRLEKELAAYQTVKEELREEMLYIELNADGRIHAINDLCTQATGFKISELEGKSLESLMDPKSLKKSDVQDMLGAVKNHRHWHGAVSFNNAKGHEIWVRGIIQPIDDAYGNVKCISFYMAEQTRNISYSNELRDMIAALHRSSAVIEFNLDGTIIKANENFLKGLGYKALGLGVRGFGMYYFGNPLFQK